MQLRPIGSNQTEILQNNGTVVFFSYQTPVAALLPRGEGYVRTEDFFSVTTSKHINKWLDGIDARKIPQAELESLIG